MNRVPTDAQLERFAAFIAKMTLEIERDLRQPELLRTVMSPPGWDLWRNSRPPGRFHGGAVVDADIGTPRVERLADTRAIANIVTRTDGERWGALTMKLDGSTGRWRATNLHRLYAARHYRTGPYPPVVEVSPAQRLADTSELRDRAAAALRAAEHRVADLPPLSAARLQASQMTETWSKIVTDLDRDLALLRGQQHNGQQLQRVLKRAR